MPKSAEVVTNNIHSNDSHLNFCAKGLTNQTENYVGRSESNAYLFPQKLQ